MNVDCPVMSAAPGRNIKLPPAENAELSKVSSFTPGVDQHIALSALLATGRSNLCNHSYSTSFFGDPLQT